MLQNIEINRIHPHPKNPRTDLGDLSELAESIKASGILQNLTVVPADPDEHKSKIASKKKYTGDYIVVIGHRRAAAAQISGLSEVPCTVADMDELTQLSTMLLENMQRSDLTMAEQGQGMQLMLDLGETYKGISERTGLSESTVRRRVKIVKTFGAEAVASVQDRNIKIEDYERLYEIKDPEAQSKAFEKIGTNNFDWSVNQAIQAQERAAHRAELCKAISAFAAETDAEAYKSANIVERWELWRSDETDMEKVQEIAAAAESSGGKYFFTTASGYGSNIVIYTKDGERPDPEVAKQQAAQQDAERKERKERLESLFQQAHALRVSFAKQFRVSSKTAKAVEVMVTYAMLHNTYLCEETFRAIFGIEKKFRNDWEKGDHDTREEGISKIIREYEGHSGINLRFIGAYCRLEGKRETAMTHQGEYDPNPKLTRLYEHLGALGYMISDEETALINGTHPHYASTDADDTDDWNDDE